VGRIQGTFDIGLIGAGDLAEHLAGNRARVLEVAALRGRDPLATDVVVIPGLKGHQRTLSTRSRINSHGFLSSHQGRQKCVGRHSKLSLGIGRPSVKFRSMNSERADGNPCISLTFMFAHRHLISSSTILPPRACSAIPSKICKLLPSTVSRLKAPWGRRSTSTTHYLMISTDFFKQRSRRNEFALQCPELVPSRCP
jgi:hypothetical protein